MHNTAHTHTSHNRGFTLIELSIVLVIVGLLIGGVVAGRSVLRQSEVTSAFVDAQKYISAVGAFQQKYSALPGDMGNATSYWGIAAGSTGNDATCYAAGTASSPATCNGNGDGQINYTGTYINETLRVWQHLADAGFITGTYTGITGTTHVIGTNSPAGKVTGLGFGLAWAGTLSSDTYAFDGVYGHRLYIGANYAASPPVGAVLTGIEAQSIDSKYDDGLPALGQIRTWKNGAYSLTCASTAVATTAVYSTSNTKACSLMMITGF